MALESCSARSPASCLRRRMRSLDVVALSTPRLSPQRRLMSEIRVLARSPRKRALRWRRSERATVRAARLRAGPVKFDSALSQERLFQRDGLFSGSPAGPQWPRRYLSTKGHLKKFRHFRIKGNCQPFENCDGRILSAPLKSADVRPINAGVDGQRLLRQLAANAEPSDISGYHGLRFHGRKRPFVGLLNHGQ
jgi:hypothetical protein